MSETKITQAELDALSGEVRQLLNGGPKLQKLENDLRDRANNSVEAQYRFLLRVRDQLELAQVADYGPAPTIINGDGRKRPGKDNPWSREGWSLTKQMAVHKALGADKAAQIAAAADCKIGDTHPSKNLYA